MTHKVSAEELKFCSYIFVPSLSITHSTLFFQILSFTYFILFEDPVTFLRGIPIIKRRRTSLWGIAVTGSICRKNIHSKISSRFTLKSVFL